jgi:hypothetical protein
MHSDSIQVLAGDSSRNSADEKSGQAFDVRGGRTGHQDRIARAEGQADVLAGIIKFYHHHGVGKILGPAEILGLNDIIENPCMIGAGLPGSTIEITVTRLVLNNDAHEVMLKII